MRPERLILNNFRRRTCFVNASVNVRSHVYRPAGSRLGWLSSSQRRCRYQKNQNADRKQLSPVLAREPLKATSRAQHVDCHKQIPACRVERATPEPQFSIDISHFRLVLRCLPLRGSVAGLFTREGALTMKVRKRAPGQTSYASGVAQYAPFCGSLKEKERHKIAIFPLTLPYKPLTLSTSLNCSERHSLHLFQYFKWLACRIK